MFRILARRCLARVSLLAGVAVITTSCSNGSEPPRGGRALFTEADYGVSSSPRITTNPGPLPRGGGSFKVGSPYKVAGQWYVPHDDPHYDRTGVGSWYGDDFHGRRTANGELFDKSALTAAHPTLPLPSYAYVTNLNNGRTVLVRVNDRGPYVGGRLIDLSHASARAIGYDGPGRAPVRVRYAGRAPLNGDDRRERRFLAEQRAKGGRAPTAVVRPPYAAPPTAGRWSPTGYRAALAGK